MTGKVKAQPKTIFQVQSILSTNSNQPAAQVQTSHPNTDDLVTRIACLEQMYKQILLRVEQLENQKNAPSLSKIAQTDANEESMSDVDEDDLVSKITRQASPENITEKNPKFTAAQLLPHMQNDRRVVENSIRMTFKSKQTSGPGFTLVESQNNIRSSRTRGTFYTSPQNKISREYFFKNDTKQTPLQRNEPNIFQPIKDTSPVIQL